MTDVALIVAAVVMGMAAIPAMSFMLWLLAPFAVIGVGIGTMLFVCVNHSVPPLFGIAGMVLVAAGGMWLLERYDDGL
jgi:uncharacterized membrane protein YesL